MAPDGTHTMSAARDAIRAEANPATFPVDLLPGHHSALLLFCAGFLGRNDGIHLWDAGIRDVQGIDNDETLVTQMRKLYPGWKIDVSDVYHWASRHAGTEQWELVVLDPQTNHTARCLALLPTWTSLARNTVVLGMLDHDVPNSPASHERWKMTRIVERNDTARWVVYRRQQ